MNRKIKFRGKRVDDGEWIFGNLYAMGFEAYIFQGLDEVAVDPDTVGQFVTKIGTQEIYEGDVLDVWWQGNASLEGDSHPDSVTRCQVRWGGDNYPAFDLVYSARTSLGTPCFNSWAEEYNSFSTDDWDYKIVGNVHDNPEWLEG